MVRLFLARLFAPAILAAGMGVMAMAPASARVDDLVRVIVDIADVIYHGGYPYYRYGPGYGYGDRLVVVRDRHYRPTYYRYAPRVVYRTPPPRGHAYGYYRNAPVQVRYVDRDYGRDDYRYGRDDRRRWNGGDYRGKPRGDRHRRGGRGWDD